MAQNNTDVADVLDRYEGTENDIPTLQIPDIDDEDLMNEALGLAKPVQVRAPAATTPAPAQAAAPEVIEEDDFDMDGLLDGPPAVETAADEVGPGTEAQEDLFAGQDLNPDDVTDAAEMQLAEDDLDDLNPDPQPDGLLTVEETRQPNGLIPTGDAVIDTATGVAGESEAEARSRRAKQSAETRKKNREAPPQAAEAPAPQAEPEPVPVPEQAAPKEDGEQAEVTARPRTEPEATHTDDTIAETPPAVQGMTPQETLVADYGDMTRRDAAYFVLGQNAAYREALAAIGKG